MTSNDLQRIQSLLCSVAADAGKFILDIYSKGTFVVRKKTDNSPVTAADIGSQELILSFLEKHFPDIPIVSEELADSANKIATRELFFLVDPLDSTKNFVTGIPFFNISLALVHKGLTIVGVIRDPVHEITYGAYRGGGATKNATPIHVRPCASLTDADLDVNATKLQEEPYRRIAFEIMPTAKKVRYFGSAVLETCWIAGGALDGVLNHNLSTWDIAAATLILEEAGGIWGNLDGSVYRMDTQERRPFLACGDKRLFSEIVSVLRGSQ